MNSVKNTILAVILFIFTPYVLLADWVIAPGSVPQTGRYEDMSFVNENTGWFAGPTIVKTTDGGNSFTVQFDTNAYYFRSIAFQNAMTGWAGSINGYLFKTTNGGTNWLRVDQLINPAPFGFCGMYVTGSAFYGSGRYSGPTQLIRSTNSGATYTHIDMSAYTATQIGVFFFNQNTGYIAGRSSITSEGAVILYTTNAGSTFTKSYRSNVPSEHIWYVDFLNSNFGFGSVQSFYQTPWAYVVTTNGGQSWTRKVIPGTSSTPSYAEAIDFINENTGWIASGAGNGLYQTTNGGATWALINVGNSIHSIKAVSDSIAYGCGTGIYKYSKTVTSVGNTNEVINWKKHTLQQNYPNPFNPATTFNYTLVKKTFVNFSIYNTNGELIRTFSTGQQPEGEYSYTWDASGMPSGIYYYTLITDQGMLRHKAVLIK